MSSFCPEYFTKLNSGVLFFLWSLSHMPQIDDSVSAIISEHPHEIKPTQRSWLFRSHLWAKWNALHTTKASSWPLSHLLHSSVESPRNQKTLAHTVGLGAWFPTQRNASTVLSSLDSFGPNSWLSSLWLWSKDIWYESKNCVCALLIHRWQTPF